MASHLLQQFMSWKVPSRTLGMPLSTLLRDSQKTFQTDYLDDGKEDSSDLTPLGSVPCVQQGMHCSLWCGGVQSYSAVVLVFV